MYYKLHILLLTSFLAATLSRLTNVLSIDAR